MTFSTMYRAMLLWLVAGSAIAWAQSPPPSAMHLRSGPNGVDLVCARSFLGQECNYQKHVLTGDLDLDRAVMLCGIHGRVDGAMIHPSNPPVPVTTYPTGWAAACNKVLDRWGRSWAVKQEREQAAKEATDLEFVKDVAAQQ